MRSGTYYENVVLNKQLILKGIGMPVVNGSKNVDFTDYYIDKVAFTIEADGCLIDSFKIVGIRIRRDPFPFMMEHYRKLSGIGIVSDYNIVKNNTILELDDGIFLTSSSNTIINNTVLKTELGIHMDISSKNKIIGNNLSKNNCGIYLYGPCKNNIFTNNTISNNKVGVQWLYYCTHNTFDRNIVLSDGYDVRLLECSDNILSNNIIQRNISLVRSHNNTLLNNTILEPNTILVQRFLFIISINIWHHPTRNFIHFVFPFENHGHLI